MNTSSMKSDYLGYLSILGITSVVVAAVYFIPVVAQIMVIGVVTTLAYLAIMDR